MSTPADDTAEQIVRDIDRWSRAGTFNGCWAIVLRRCREWAKQNPARLTRPEDQKGTK